MSEVIEDYIRRHPGLTQAEAVEKFLDEDRIRAWVGQDPARRDRIAREFSRIWNALHSGQGTQVQVQRPATTPAPAPRIGPSGPSGPPPPVHVLPPPPEPPQATDFTSRKVHVLCSACHRYAIYARGTQVACAACGSEFDDMLSLVPVTPVGPFAFLFGEGWVGYATAGALLLLLVLLYGALRWV